MQLRQLSALLLDFERLPGRYAVVRREPAALFEQAPAVLQLAAGRSVEGLDALAPMEQEQMRRGARFFVRAALLRQGADHYTLLGLTQNASSEQVREHYRLMIRMTHPDFEVGGEHWPADSAARINIANDVLSSPLRRREYDEALNAAEPVVAPPPADKLAQPTKVEPSRTRGRAHGDRGWSTRTKAALAGGGALLCLGALVALNGGDNGSLTARERTVADDTAAYSEQGFGVFKRAASTESTVQSPAPVTAAPAAASRERSPAVAPAPRPREQTPRREAVAALDPSAVATPVAADTPQRLPEADALPATTLQLSRQMTTAKDEPAPMLVVKAKPAEAAPAAPRLSAQAVHPLMTNVLASLSSGRGESLAQWIAPEWRGRPSNQAFVSQFNQWLGGQKVQEVSKVALTSQLQGETLMVDGVVQLGIAPSPSSEPTRNLRLRAYFQLQDGQPVLTQLTASEPQ